jgi:hypothetical protein
VTDKVKETDGKTQIYLEISFYQEAKDIKNIYSQHCRIFVDEQTQVKFVDLFETNDGMIGLTCKIQAMGAEWT